MHAPTPHGSDGFYAAQEHLRITLHATGRTGVQTVRLVGASEEVDWSDPSDASPVELARIERITPDGTTTDCVLLDGDAWRAFEATGALLDVVNDVRSGSLIVDALAAQLNEVTNEYACDCGACWQDSWSCACHDECPGCGTDVSPSSSTWHRELTAQVESDVEVFVIRSEQPPCQAPSATPQPVGGPAFGG